MDEEEFTEYVKGCEIADLKERLIGIMDVKPLREALKVVSDPDVREEIEKREAEIEKGVWEIEEHKEERGKSENGYEISVTAVGLGGCGLEIIKRIVRASKRFGDYYKIIYYAYDLSDDVHRETEGITLITPTALDIGAGRVPFCAEFVFEEETDGAKAGKEEAKKIYVSSINLFPHSLGGGTGSKTVSLLIPELKKRGGTASIALSVLTDRNGLEKTNHLLSFYELNKTADFIILTENKRGREILEDRRIEKNELEFVNEKMVDVFDFIISARDKNAHEGPMDLNNYINGIRGWEEYYKGIRWFIPFVWPIIGEYEDRYKEHPLFRFLEMALDKGSLVRVKSGAIKCKSCVLIVKAPRDFIHKIYMDKTIEKLSKKVGLRKEFITPTFIPDENGLKLCLLLYGTPFEMLYELMDVDDELIKRGLNSWKNGLREYMKQLNVDIPPEKKIEYENKASKDPRVDFEEVYGEFCGAHEQ